MSVTHVAAALIWRGNKFMICRRPPHKTRGLLWEFVGGKLEPGETAEQALVRECREELGVEVTPGKLFMEVVHTYPDMTVRLTVFNADIGRQEPQLLEHSEITWITSAEIDEYDFCPADGEILAKIKAECPAEPDERTLRLFESQKELLDTFLSTGALDRAQYEKSLNGLKEKLGL